MFPKSESSPDNTVMKRIQIPEHDNSFAKQVNEEIKTVKENEAGSVYHAESKNSNIVYIALKKSDKNVSSLKRMTLRQGSSDMFKSLDSAWRSAVLSAESQLFEDSNAGISYAFVPLFPKSQTDSSYHAVNAVMKRIQIPENDEPFAELVEEEIETLKNIRFFYGRSENHRIVYIALEKTNKNLASLKPQQVIFRILDNAWSRTTSESRLFGDSNAGISYAFLPMFPKSEKSSHNTVMKRIQIPEHDDAFADKEIETVKKLNEAGSFYHGKSETPKIVYIALDWSNKNVDRKSVV